MSTITIPKERIFVAIRADEALADKIAEWREKYKNLSVKWVAPESLHITLVPPWYEAEVEKVAAKLKRISSEPFEMVFDRVTFRPRGKSPRLIWVEGIAPEEVRILVKSLERALGRRSAKRSWKLHLTLARFSPQKFAASDVEKINVPVHWKMEVKSFVLMESQPSPKGAEYGIIGEYELHKNDEV